MELCLFLTYFTIELNNVILKKLGNFNSTALVSLINYEDYSFSQA
jgi:hypothetical protein